MTVHYKGIPKPTITWMFNGSHVEENYATELSSDGSVILVCVEEKHAGEYVNYKFLSAYNITGSYYHSVHDRHSLN